MKERTSSIQVIDRMACLLTAIADKNEPVSLKVLSAETGLHPSTALRILYSSIDIGFVERTQSGNYQLGNKLMQLGSLVRTRVDVRREALPIMESLRDQIDETVNLTVREGDQVIYVERCNANRMMRVEQVIGSRAPLHVTAVGKLMLGTQGNTYCNSYARRTKLPAYTPNTITNTKDLLTETANAIKLGYAYDNEEAELGVGCIGVLIRDASNSIVAGLSVSAPIDRRKDEWIPLIVDAGKKISARLGYYSV